MKKIILMVLAMGVALNAFALPVVRYIEFKIYDPVYVAIEKGFFRNRGIEVKLHGAVLAGANSVQAVAGGSAEAAMTNMFSLINGVSAGVPVIGVSDIQSVLLNQPLERFFVREDSGITDVRQMKGKVWAINNLKASFHYTVIMHMNKIGMDINSFSLKILSFPQQIQAIENKQVDMVSLMEPYGTMLAQKGGYREVFTAIDTFGGPRQMSAIFIGTKWAEKNPDQATAFCSGIADAINWIELNQDEAKIIIAKYLDLDPKNIPDYHFTKDGRMVESDVQWAMDFLIKQGDVKNQISPSLVVTNKYNLRMAK